MKLVSGWRFGRADAREDELTEVCLPHCVTRLSWRDWDLETWQHRWSYRRTIEIPLAWQGMRVLLGVGAAMVEATVRLDGREVGRHLGGYLPFTVELPADAATPGAHELEIEVDGRWKNVPPEGSPVGPTSIDYLEPSGLYRDVTLQAVPPAYVSDLFARATDVLDPERRALEVTVTLDATEPSELDGRRLDVRLETLAGQVIRETSTTTLAPGPAAVDVRLEDLAEVELWDVENPLLYRVVAILRGSTDDRGHEHEHAARFGFRHAEFRPDGFFLNGRRHQIRGLNRHQLYPYAGGAMPPRVQRHDAELLRNELNCTMVRCAHYPQAPEFLDACDELGLLVWEEIPGWQYVGPDDEWRALAVRDTRDMVIRDRNRPSVVVWGVQINESNAVPDLYDRTRAAAYELDGTRQTSGSMTKQDLEGWQQDVYAFDDYHHTDEDAILLPPLENLPYLIAESIGALSGPHFYRHADDDETLTKQGLLHARVHSIAGSDRRYSGLIGWVAFDYGSLSGFVDRNVKTPGLGDGMRILKLGAGFYRSQVDPSVRPVLLPSITPTAGHWPAERIVVWSNADRLEAYVDGKLHVTAHPAAEDFPAIDHPPFYVDLSGTTGTELRLDAYLDTNPDPLASQAFTVDPSGDRLELTADDDAIVADGEDATRLEFRVVDRYGWPRRGTSGDLALALDGPGVLVGDNPFALADNGGCGAVWLRGRPGEPGRLRVTATHQAYGSVSISLETTRP